MEAFEDPISKIPSSIGHRFDSRYSRFKNNDDTLCGLGPFKPNWIQRFATKNCFIAMFSIIGIIQGITWSYFIATISTLEKRLKISSQTTGIVMTGNEISQTMLAVILSYYGGNGHRPRWMSVGVALSAMSCFLLASPHIFYGPGDEALSLTEEFYYSFHEFHNHSHFLHTSTIPEVGNFTGVNTHHNIHNNSSNEFSKGIQLCEPDSDWTEKNLDCGAGEKSILPLVLIFLSQFIAGIGGVLFTTLGGPYMDDNMEQIQMPLIVGITMSLRLIGPILGYALAYICLKTYISPSLTPRISSEDPRWLGAWWAGWVLLGIVMVLTSCVIALFPKELRKDGKANRKNSYGVRETNSFPRKENEEADVLKSTIIDLFRGIKSLSQNKINMYNNLAAVCYLFGFIGFGTYMNKYMETIYKVSSSVASIPGAIKIGFQAIGLLLSGVLISKYQPSARKLAGLNVITGLIFVVALVAFTQIICHQGNVDFGTENPYSKTWNLTEGCNSECNCKAEQMSPVCFKEKKKIYYSACHAGCTVVDIDNATISNCSCLPSLQDSLELGTCVDNCFPQFVAFITIGAFLRILDSFGRIGNLLIGYRCVHPKQKALAVGIGLFLVNLFGMLPSPIVFGALIDSVCLVWGTKCGAKGNCLMYDGEKLVYVFNLTVAGCMLLGLIFDSMVCYYVKDLDLYDETKNHHTEVKTQEKTNIKREL